MGDEKASLQEIVKKNEEVPDNVKQMLESADSWSFNIFEFNEITKNEPLKYVAQHLFNHYDLFRKFLINPTIFNNFITKIEKGYQVHNNSYHNNIHAADVTQTLNAMLCETKLNEWLTDLEIFAALLSAIIHDYDHNGKTNAFHVATGSDMALLYNDRSVQENHHISASFFLLQEDKYNILAKLSREDYSELRMLVIEVILGTDISYHFTLLKDVKTKLISSHLVSKSKILGLTLHAADISHACKKYPINLMWSSLLSDEFFEQGDLERELNMPISPLCDRTDDTFPDTQLNFMDFIVNPTFTLFYEMAKFVTRLEEGKTEHPLGNPWLLCFTENRQNWQRATRQAQSASSIR